MRNLFMILVVVALCMGCRSQKNTGDDEKENNTPAQSGNKPGQNSGTDVGGTDSLGSTDGGGIIGTDSGPGLVPPTDGDIGGDTDIDTDTDVDMDTDGDSDHDHDSDGVTDDDPDETTLVTDAEGRIRVEYNDYGVQGDWFSVASEGTTITVTSDSSYGEQGNAMCAEGVAAEVVEGPDGDYDWGTYWGAIMGFSLCATGPDVEPPDTTYTLSTCPFNPTLAKTFRGIEFSVDGDWETYDGELRCIFKEAGRDQNAYVPFQGEGRHRCLVEDAQVWYDTSLPGPNLDEIEGIHFQVPTMTDTKTPFDFCIYDIEIIVDSGDEIETDTAPEADTDEDIEYPEPDLPPGCLADMMQGDSERCDLFMECDQDFVFVGCEMSDDWANCFCEGKMGGGEINFGVNAGVATCSYAAMLCVSDDPIDSEEAPNCESMRVSSSDEDCSASQECEREGIAFGNVPFYLDEYQNVWCNEEDEEWRCECAAGGNSITFGVALADWESITCEGAMAACQQSDMTYGEISGCRVASQTSSRGEECYAELECGVEAAIGSIPLDLKGSVGVSCEITESAGFVCSCSVGGGMEMEVETGDVWDACTEAAAMCQMNIAVEDLI